MKMHPPVLSLAAALVLFWTGVATAQCGCTADADGSGAVDVDDLVAVITGWGGVEPDLTGDGVVNVDDLVAVIQAWGVCLQGGTFPVMWINGVSCAGEVDIQVHAYNEDCYILRQSVCTNFEAPFMYLLFGEDKVLMQDTGAGGVAIADTVYGIIDDWLAARGQSSIELIVTHSHGHGDHVAGDSQFEGQPNTTVVDRFQSSVASFFGITDWPEQIVEYDLGNRVVDVIPIPGHQTAHIALYDRRTGLLLTGDTLYPGRLYISSFTQYYDSITRMLEFTENVPVCWVLGTHIEMTNTPGVDFPLGASSHPNERELQLTRDHLQELWQGVRDMTLDPVIEEHDDFIIWPF